MFGTLGQNKTPLLLALKVYKREVKESPSREPKGGEPTEKRIRSPKPQDVKEKKKRRDFRGDINKLQKGRECDP